MRITSGRFRGRVLKAPAGDAVRPTSDMVRQAVFNVLLKYGHPIDSVVIDAFSGTGALGLESLSRGARFCTFIDRDKTSLSFTKDNAAMLDIAAQAHFIFGDATKVSTRPVAMDLADLVFLDPPYRKGLIIPALLALDQGGWLSDHAIIVAESESEWDLAANLPAGYALLDSKSYGSTLIHIAQREGAA